MRGREREKAAAINCSQKRVHVCIKLHNTDTEAPGCTGSQAPIINLAQDCWRAE